MSADSSGYCPDALDAIRHVVSGFGDPPKPSNPDSRMPIWKAVSHIAMVLGEADEKRLYPATRDAIRQAAAQGDIEIWGRRELPVPMESGFPSEVWTPINPLYWRTHIINFLAASEMWEAEIHSASEPLMIGETSRYWALQVKPSDVDRFWTIE